MKLRCLLDHRVRIRVAKQLCRPAHADIEGPLSLVDRQIQTGFPSMNADCRFGAPTTRAEHNSFGGWESLYNLTSRIGPETNPNPTFLGDVESGYSCRMPSPEETDSEMKT